MDYTGLPRHLIYKDRTSLDDFGVYDKPSLNNFIFERLFEKYSKLVDFEGFVMKLFNKSYYICTMAAAEKRPELRFGAYLHEASFTHFSINCKGVVLAIVLLQFWTRRWDMHKHRLAPLSKLIENELREGYFDEIFAAFYVRITQEMQATGINKIDSEDEFVPREITRLVLRDCYFDWCNMLGNDEEKVWNFISAIGKNEKEQKTMVEFLRDELYSEFDNELEKNYFFNNLDREIRKRFHGEEDRAREQAEFEAFQQQETLKELEAEWHKERHEALEKIVAQQKLEIEQLKNVAKEQQSQVAPAQNHEADNNEKIKALEEELEHYKQMYEVADNQLKRYETILGTTEELSKEKMFSIAERIIFCSSLLGCSLSEDDIIQQQMAKMIRRFSGDKWEAIRTTISKMNGKRNDLVEVANNAKKAKDAGARMAVWRKEEKKFKGITNAALNVYNYLHSVVKGGTVAAKIHQCKQAMENIDHAYYLSERKLITSPYNQPEGDEDKFILPLEEI